MKALSLWQPWASLMVMKWPEGRFIKQLETRSRKTHYRGPLAIVATASIPKEYRNLHLQEPFHSALMMANPEGYALPFGKVLGICELYDCVPTEVALTRYCAEIFEKDFGDYSPNRFAWITRNMMVLPKPIPVKGHQFLWDWPEGDAIYAKMKEEA